MIHLNTIIFYFYLGQSLSQGYSFRLEAKETEEVSWKIGTFLMDFFPLS